MAFACRRATAGATARRITTTTRSTKIIPRAALVTPPAAPIAPKPKPVTAAKSPVDQLAQARELADGGKLEEAMQICHLHLEQRGASVQAYYLLGVIHDAQGNAVAQDFYRKALYLDPNHYESLLQMALLAEKNGDSGTARNLRRRAQRLQTQA
jgi:chemotaxis protein methyltransferase WspC